MTEPSFTFDGHPVPLRPGQSVAAALTEVGQRVFRKTASGAGRGIFCGMGVCQDCLVTIDGVPNQRACMTPATAGLGVETQVPFATLDTIKAAEQTVPARIIEPDVLIIGAGAGGLSAAIAARRAGASVIVLDERKIAGGQFFKQSASGSLLDKQQAEGAKLLMLARESGAEILSEVEIWGAFDGLLFLAEHRGSALIARPRTAIVATGAYERALMVPGWTLPGVMTTGAAQTLWRSYQTLPGKRVAICGSGPLNAQVALELVQGGAEVVMLAETARSPFRQPGASLAMALSDPRLALRGLGILHGLRQRKIPVSYQTDLIKIEQTADDLEVEFRAVSGATTSLQVDALCMNIGFEPQNEILRLLGTDMVYDPAFAHLRCTRSDLMETSVPGVFAVGDCAGLGGAPAALVEGRIAGRAAAAINGHGDGDPTPADLRALAQHRKFQARLWQVYDPAAPDLEHAPDDLILCRCEEINLGQVRAGLEDEPGHIGTLKRATRVGMGRCQGRYCGPAVARLVARSTGKPIEDFSHFAPRVPIKPVSIAAILAAQEALDDAD